MLTQEDQSDTTTAFVSFFWILAEKEASKMKCVNWKLMCELWSGLIEVGMNLQNPSSRLLSFAHVFSLRNPPGGEILKKNKFASEKASRMLRAPEFLRKTDRRYYHTSVHMLTHE